MVFLAPIMHGIRALTYPCSRPKRWCSVPHTNTPQRVSCLELLVSWHHWCAESVLLVTLGIGHGLLWLSHVHGLGLQSVSPGVAALCGCGRLWRCGLTKLSSGSCNGVSSIAKGSISAQSRCGVRCGWCMVSFATVRPPLPPCRVCCGWYPVVPSGATGRSSLVPS